MAGQLTTAAWMRGLALPLAAVLVAGCGRQAEPPANRPNDPLFAGLKALPVNMPAFQFAIAPIDGDPTLPAGTLPALALVAGGHPVRAVGTLPGRVTTRGDRIEVQGLDGARIDVLYRLPQGVPAPSETASSGDLSVIEHQKTAGDSTRQVLICSEGSLLLARISLASASPVTTDLGTGLSLAQRQATGLLGGTATDVIVEAFDEGHAVGTIPVGKLTAIRTSTGVFQALVESSRHESAYVLDAWVVRSR